MKPSVWTMTSRKNKKNLGGYLLILLLLFLFNYALMEKNGNVNSIEKVEKPVFVRFEGDVSNPGVYSFKGKNELLKFLKKELSDQSIDISWLLNSEPQWDTGITLKVSKIGSDYHYDKKAMYAYRKVTLGIPIDINKESVQGLTAIPGIGKSLALTIEEERIKRNGFRDINELKDLPGIGEKLFLKITPYVRL